MLRVHLFISFYVSLLQFRTLGDEKFCFQNTKSILANKQEAVAMPAGFCRTSARTGRRSKAPKASCVGGTGAGRHTLDMYS